MLSVNGRRRENWIQHCGNQKMAGARAHFTYIWAIENAAELHFQFELSSPVFTVKSTDMTQWRLWLVERFQFVSLYLRRVKEDDGPKEIEVQYELSFLGTDGSSLIKKADSAKFFKDDFGGMRTLEETYDIFTRRRAQFITKNVLTVRCRMWRNGTETPQPDVCFARTRYGMDRHCFVWAIKDFSSLSLGNKTTRLLKSTSDGAPQPTLIFCFRRSNGKIYICVDGNCETVGPRNVLIGEIALLDVDGTVVHSQKICKRLLPDRPVRLCSEFFEVQKLLSGKTALLPNDVLSLRCQLEISYGPVWSGIENCEPLESSAQERNKADLEDRLVEEGKESVAASCPFRQNVCKFYEDGTLSDVTLRVDAETFPVHKIVLSSRSPVFEAMFTSNMREKVSKCIDVPDVDPGTLRLLLSYIYTNELPELQWDKAADLFRAADKYALLELKKQCSAILKSNLSRTNVCCVLSLADMHHEEEIRKAVLDFISKNLDIFSSESWKIFKKKNSELAMETMERIIYITNVKARDA